MNLLEIFNTVPKVFNWYARLTPKNQTRFNHIVVLIASWVLFYFNDQQHRKNNALLTIGINNVNNLRSQEQDRYTTKLERYADKFQSFAEKQDKQEKEINQIKKEP